MPSADEDGMMEESTACTLKSLTLSGGLLWPCGPHLKRLSRFLG